MKKEESNINPSLPFPVLGFKDNLLGRTLFSDTASQNGFRGNDSSRTMTQGH